MGSMTDQKWLTGWGKQITCSPMTAIFFDILCISNLVEPLLLETLYSIRNFIANCDTTKRLLLEPVKTNLKTTATSSSLLDVLVQMAQKSHCSDDAFFGCIENLKIMALHGESRAVLLKVCVNPFPVTRLEIMFANQHDSRRFYRK